VPDQVISVAFDMTFPNRNQSGSGTYARSLVAALEGTYNEFGVRRWFERPRSTFNGRTARQLLSRRWNPSEESARSVLAAAESLQELGAT